MRITKRSSKFIDPFVLQKDYQSKFWRDFYTIKFDDDYGYKYPTNPTLLEKLIFIYRYVNHELLYKFKKWFKRTILRDSIERLIKMANDLGETAILSETRVVRMGDLSEFEKPYFAVKVENTNTQLSQYLDNPSCEYYGLVEFVNRKDQKNLFSPFDDKDITEKLQREFINQ